MEQLTHDKADEVAMIKEACDGETAHMKRLVIETRERVAESERAQAMVIAAMAVEQQKAAAALAARDAAIRQVDGMTPRPMWGSLLCASEAFTLDAMGLPDIQSSAAAAEQLDARIRALQGEIAILSDRLTSPLPPPAAAGTFKAPTREAAQFRFATDPGFIVCSGTGKSVPKFLRFNGKASWGDRGSGCRGSSFLSSPDNGVRSVPIAAPHPSPPPSFCPLSLFAGPQPGAHDQPGAQGFLRKAF